MVEVMWGKTKQAKIAFTICKYKDEVLCDIVLMYASHLLLGQPWEFDRKDNHGGFSNKYSFIIERKLIALLPIIPQQVHECNAQMKNETQKKLNLSDELQNSCESEKENSESKEKGKAKNKQMSEEL